MYANPADLAQALHLQRFDQAQQVLAERCLNAASHEVDTWCDWFDGQPPELSEGQRATLRLVTTVRATEWWKASDAPWGMLMGYSDIGLVRAPRESALRHVQALIDAGLKEAFGFA